jgi:hypothetical protein
MNSRHRLVLIGLCAVALVYSWEASAQADPDQIHRRNNCRLAEQVIRTGHPENKTAWAWEYLPSCPRGMQVPLLVIRMRQARQSTNAELVATALLRASTMRDGTLFREVMNIAADPQASVTARVYAFVTLDAIYDPSRHPRYDLFLRMADLGDSARGPCSSNRSHPLVSEDGATSIPVDYRQQITALAARLTEDSAQPRQVRGAARCLL